MSKRRVFCPTVIRRAEGEDPRGEWWLMSKRETGWAAYGYPYAYLGDLLDAWDVRLTGAGSDAHGVYLSAAPS